MRFFYLNIINFHPCYLYVLFVLGVDNVKVVVVNKGMGVAVQTALTGIGAEGGVWLITKNVAGAKAFSVGGKTQVKGIALISVKAEVAYGVKSAVGKFAKVKFACVGLEIRLKGG